jgi:hypothetical protein
MQHQNQLPQKDPQTPRAKTVSGKFDLNITLETDNIRIMKTTKSIPYSANKVIDVLLRDFIKRGKCFHNALHENADSTLLDIFSLCYVAESDSCIEENVDFT